MNTNGIFQTGIATNVSPTGIFCQILISNGYVIEIKNNNMKKG